MIAMAGPHDPIGLITTGEWQSTRGTARSTPESSTSLLASGLFGPETRVLDVGCGTGNYAAALTEATGCRVSGIDPSRRMLDRARDAAPWESLVQGSAESLPFGDDSFDVVMSTDVIHHIGDRDAYFREAARVLRPGGHIVTVTDSHDDIPRRRPLSSHFPETVSVELQRYPPVPQLLEEMARAGFVEPRLVEVSHDYELDDIQAYRDRAFSSLHLIDEEAFRARHQPAGSRPGARADPVRLALYDDLGISGQCVAGAAGTG